MHKELIIKKADLEDIDDDWDYIYTFVEKYYKLIEKDPENIINNFTNEQHALKAYFELYNEVINGGFIQLIFNSYADYIFNSPLIDTLREWGAEETANLLETIRPKCLDVEAEINKDASLKEFSEIYTTYPEFDDFDSQFYNHSGICEVREYIKKHLDNFAIIII